MGTETTPVIRLYTQRMNPFAEKVANALAMKRVAFERVLIDGPDEIKRVNPDTQMLPVIELRGERVWDSTRILDWLEERFPEPPLYSSDPKTASAQRNLAAWSDSSFAWYWNRWRTANAHNERLAETLLATGRAIPEEDEAEADPGLLGRLHGHIGRTLQRTTGSEAQRRETEIIDQVAKRLDDLVGLLADRDFFYSDTPSVADLSVYGMLRVLTLGPMPGSAERVAERATLVDYMARMSEAIPRR